MGLCLRLSEVMLDDVLQGVVKPVLEKNAE